MRSATAGSASDQTIIRADALERAVAAIPTAVIVTDLAGRISLWGGAAQDLYGFTEAEAVGQILDDLIVPDISAAASADIRPKLIRGETWSGMFTMCRKDGTSFTAYVMDSPVLGSAGELVGIIGVSHDVTRHLEAENELIERESRYRGIVETAHEGIWMIDSEARTTFANQQMADLLRCPLSELEGCSVFAFMDDEGVEQAGPILEQLAQGRPQKFEFRAIRADGVPLWTEVATSALRGDRGEVVGALAMVSDIAERRAAHEALRLSEEQFRQVFEQNPLACTIVDADLGIVGTNAAFNAMVGRTAEELEGRTINDLTHPDDIAAGAAFAARLFRGEIPSYTFDKRYLHVDGSIVTGRLTASAVRDADGKFVHAIGLIEDVTEAVRSSRTIVRQRERLVMTLEAGGLAAWELDLTTGAYTMWDNLAAVYGIDALGGPPSFADFLNVVHPEDQHLFASPPDELGATFALEFRVLRPDGLAWLRSQGLVAADEDGEPTILRGTLIDITELRRAENQRAEAAAVYRQTVEAARDAFIGVDEDGQVTDWNPAAEQMFGWTTEEAIGAALVERIFPSGDRRVYQDRIQALLDPDRVVRPAQGRIELVAQHRDGHSFPIELSLVVVTIGGVRQVRGFVRDITERQAYERELTERALVDQLTGLPNRTLLIDRLGTAIHRIGGRSGAVAILFIDIDRFKTVNDSLGHSAGDSLLSSVAGRLRGAVRPDDTVARHGADEFIVLCEDLTDPSQAVATAERIFTALEARFTIGSREHTVSVSVGVAYADSPSTSPEALIRDADIAMFKAKTRGGGHYEVFDDALRGKARERLDLEDELRRALDTGALSVAYQPVFNLDHRLVGMEALARWEHPVRGSITPAEFIPVAEETGLIVALGAEILDRACQQLAEWRQQPGGQLLTVAVNLSGRQLTEPDLAPSVARTLERHGLPATALSLEITESMLMDESSIAAATLEALAAVGVVLAVDDFGTGYSSMLYLRRFPVHVLKLDRSFVAGLASNAIDRAIVGSMIDLAHGLGLVAIAEGVEDDQQLEALRDLGCDQIQGFYWSKPLTPAAFTTLLEDESARRPSVAGTA